MYWEENKTMDIYLWNNEGKLDWSEVGTEDDVKATIDYHQWNKLQKLIPITYDNEE